LRKTIGKPPQLVDSVKNLVKELERKGRFFQGWNQKTKAIKVVGRKIRSLLRKYIHSVKELDSLYDEIMRNLTQIG
jgi:predicted patatin/cPLA2 family phospholipase